MSDLSLNPEEVLRRYAKQLDARREIDPSARPWYDIFGDALMWPDESVPNAPMELIGPVRRLYYHRMGLILGEDWGQGEFWQLARELFPNWVGFHPSRCNPSDELARIYHTYASNLKRELEEMDKLCDEEGTFKMESVQTFKAKRGRLILEVVAVIGAGVLLVIWKRAAIGWFLVTFLLSYLAYRLLLSGVTIKTVRLRPDGVDVVPLLPWFRPRKWQLDEIAAYRSVAFRGNVKSKPFMGILTPKEGKPETIWASGTDRFIILDEFLSKLLPTPND